MADQWQLDERLKRDSYLLGAIDNSVLLLMKNALFPWFVIVPRTTETEFYKLGSQQQASVLEQVNLVSDFIEKNFQVDKLNVATIGNLVSQMHVHVVGRNIDDPCWPGVVWGCDQSAAYEDGNVSVIRNKLLDAGLIIAE